MCLRFPAACRRQATMGSYRIVPRPLPARDAGASAVRRHSLENPSSRNAGCHVHTAPMHRNVLRLGFFHKAALSVYRMRGFANRESKLRDRPAIEAHSRRCRRSSHDAIDIRNVGSKMGRQKVPEWENYMSDDNRPRVNRRSVLKSSLADAGRRGSGPDRGSRGTRIKNVNLASSPSA